jgi:hypothetical protein
MMTGVADNTPIAPPAELDALKGRAPGHDPALPPQHRPPPLGRQVQARQAGRPITRRSIRALVLRVAARTRMGYRRIHGELAGPVGGGRARAGEWIRVLRRPRRLPGTRRQGRRQGRWSGKVPRCTAPIMADCVPCLFRKTDARRGSCLACRDPGRPGSARCHRRSRQWQPAVTSAGPGQGRRCGAPSVLDGPDDLGHSA